MNNSSLSVLLASVGLSFTLGFGIAWNIQSPYVPKEEIPVVAVQPARPSESQPASMNQLTGLWAKAGTEQQQQSVGTDKPVSVEELLARATVPVGKRNQDYFAVDKLSKLALSDPAVMRTLLQRYESERNQNAKEVLKSILSLIQKPEVLALSTKLATSGDPAQRREGFEMLQNASLDSAEARNVVKQALATEQNPSVLVQVLAALKPVSVEPAESDAIVAQLRNLSQNSDPAVRSQSITQLGQWDKKGDAQDRVTQALTDQAPEVRQAAIWAIAQSGIRSDGAKAALLSILSNANEGLQVKGSVLQVLERFQLSKEELLIYNQAHSNL